MEVMDAIHIAVVKVQAGEQNLQPGDHVGFIEGTKKVGKNTKNLIGIIDPFLNKETFQSDLKYNNPSFFILLYPNTTKCLTHQWIHPEFNKDKSVEWITNFASNLRISYDQLMEVAHKYVYGDGHTMDNSERYKDYYEEFQIFWEHFEIVTGIKVYHKECPYTCSC